MTSPTTEIILSPARALQPAPLFTPTPKAAKRVLEFFTAQVNNDHTRKAYLNATRRFAAWCDEEGAETEEPALVGWRDRALIGVMVYPLRPHQRRAPDESA